MLSVKYQKYKKKIKNPLTNVLTEPIRSAVKLFE